MPARSAAPGMPEWGMLPIPKKLLEQGVRDMLRISDARMSGTSYGACILHVAPESYVGGPLALVRDGDIDHGRRGDALDPPRLRAMPNSRAGGEWHKPPRAISARLSRAVPEHIGQANEGCDFDFLEGAEGIPEPEIH